MWPSSADEAKGVINATNAGSSSSKSIAIGLKELACPIGTVPIRRTTKEELSRAKASFREQFQRSISEAGPAPRLMDKSSGNWWLTYGDSDTRIGYWSSSIFTNLKDGAEVLRWGGQVYSSVPSMPVMGSGEMDDYFGSHYRQVSLRYESGSSLNGTLDAPLEILQSRCYKAGNNAYKGEYWGYSFWFGGTGGDIQQCL
ncbi:Protein of Unknown Function (DUF239) [Quillaja saponaria]|uniref:Neprosin PEP catalytic domain-containing protein n=1 Tax=Quillaja saponaria TaxID=32244 RepID=A0AAD7M4I2_QUISA|nr:Protein of Unknown Function (DUF239) [Quillaja saponaria]